MKLTIFSAILILLTFVFRVIFKEWLKDLQESITAAENLFRLELSSTSLQLQFTKMQMDLDAAQGKSALMKAKRTKNFSAFIAKDRIAVMQRRAELGQMEDSTLRLLRVLPRRAANLKSFSPIEREVKRVTEAAREVEKSSLSGGVDWPQSGFLKIKIMELAFAEIQVALFADRVLARATEVREAAERLYRICNWIGYFLYAVGLGLAVYANLSGLKTIIGSE